MLASVSLFIISAILSSFLGYRTYIKPYIFIEFILFVSVFFVDDLDLKSFVKTIKSILLVFLLGTVVLVFVSPAWSIQFQYNQGLLDFLSARLYGLTTNSNYTAPLIMLYLIFELEWPMKKSIWRVATILLSVLVLFFTQSKTIWILLALYFFIKLVGSYWPKLRVYITKRTVVISSTVLILLLALFIVIGKPTSLTTAIDQETNLTTFTGRTIIWDFTLDAWKNNKTFGYGMGLWDTEMFNHYKSQIKPGWVFSHAHSQYFQSLGESGIVGLSFLLVYFLFLLYLGIKYARMTRGLSLFLALFMIIRGWTEPVCRHFLTDLNFYMHLIVFTYFVILTRLSKQGKIS